MDFLKRAVAAVTLGGLLALGGLFVVNTVKPPADHSAQEAVLFELCQQVSSLDDQIELIEAPPGSGWLAERQKELPGLRWVRGNLAEQYNDMGGAYGLPAKISKQRPDC